MNEEKRYVKIWLSYDSYFELLSDEEVGRLIHAMMKYRSTGEEPQLEGNERFIWPAIRRDIDTSIEAHKRVSEANRENGKKGGRPKKTVAKYETEEKQENQFGFFETEKRQGNGKGKGNGIGIVKGNCKYIPPSPPDGGWGFGDLLNKVFDDWLQYKCERREPYTPKGLQSLTTQIKNKAEIYGEEAVIDVIRDSMAHQWKGICYDLLQDKKSQSTKQEKTSKSDYSWMKEYIQKRDYKT